MQSLLNISQNVFIRKLDINDIAQIKDIQNIILAESDHGFIHPRSDETLIDYLSNSNNVVFGLETEDKIIAFGVLNVPKKNQRNKSLRFKIVPDEEWAYHSCFIESAMVLPNYRGKGLQKILIETRIAAAITCGMKWLCAGVKFDNYKSWGNLLAKGLVIVGYRVDLGYLILGLAQKLNGPVLRFENKESMSVNIFDEQGHRTALDNGFLGINVVSEKNCSSVVYKRIA